MPAKTRLSAVLDRLEKAYGRPSPIPPRGPFEHVLWENVAYLVSDERRREAFRALKQRVGTEPQDILAASDDVLHPIAAMGGMHPERRVAVLRDIAGKAVKEFDGKLDRVLDLPLGQALKALRQFPSIGEPGAEKILLLCGARPLFALESNAVRVLLRLGYGEEAKSYSTTYRKVREAVEREIDKRVPWLVRARELLRRHGQEVCKRSAPLCEACPLQESCRYWERIVVSSKRI